MTKLERQEWVAGLGYEGQGFKQSFLNSLFLPAVSLWVALLSSTNIGGRGRGSGVLCPAGEHWVHGANPAGPGHHPHRHLFSLRGGLLLPKGRLPGTRSLIRALGEQVC